MPLRLRSTALYRAAMLIAAASTGTSPASAAERSFAGTWSQDAKSCKLAQEVQGAPVIMTAKGYDQHEAHCAFKSVKRMKGNSWRIKASCMVEGDAQADTFTLRVAGDTLFWSHGAGAAMRLQRCK